MREAYIPDKIKGSSREFPCTFLLLTLYLSILGSAFANDSMYTHEETVFVGLFPDRRKVWGSDERLAYKRGAPMILPEHLPAAPRVLGVF